MIYMTPTLETNRLVLKRGTFLDYKKVYQYDFRKLRNIAGEFEFILQNEESIIGFDTYADTEDSVFDWIVYLKENGTPIANITADREEVSINSIELAFNMHPNYWRMGYMTEALIIILDYLFENGFNNVMCGYSEGNIKSKHLIEKLGFTLYKIIPNAWEKNGISITDYKTIMSKDTFLKLYKNSQKKL